MKSFANSNSIDELRVIARRKLPRAVFDFVDGAAEAEVTLASNRSDLAAMRFVPRYPVDVGERNLATRLFDRDVALPLFIAPTGLAALVWPKADIELARAAGAFGIPFTISMSSSVRLEDIAAAATATQLWFQMYLYRDQKIVRSVLDRCKAAGIATLVVTVDVPVLGNRRRDHTNRFSVPLRPTLRMAFDAVRCLPWSLGMIGQGVPRMQNLVDYGSGKDLASLQDLTNRIMDASVTWEGLGWLRDNWQGKLIIKGILAAEDAIEAQRRGFDAVIVSNHGGRQLDGAVSSIAALQEIRTALGGKFPLLMDGGIRSGADLAKTVAAGAVAAGVGRATLFGAAAAGEAGVRHALTLLRQEFDRALALLGCRATAELNSRFLAPAGAASIARQPAPGAKLS